MPDARIGHINSLILRKLAAIGGLEMVQGAESRFPSKLFKNRVVFGFSSCPIPTKIPSRRSDVRVRFHQGSLVSAPGCGRRAQPCQGWGRGFESLRPLQIFSRKSKTSRRPSGAVFAYKGLVGRICKPEVTTGRRVRAGWVARFAADRTRADGGERWLRGIRRRAVECRRLWPQCWLDGSEREGLVGGACGALPPPGFPILGSGGSSRTALSLGVADQSQGGSRG